jgi:16S rRNA (cytidine1402-2'-O)-methyltransferase
MLTLVATPIGNLSDISLRAIETLKKCDGILCEDTRHSGVLLQAHGIEKPLVSYHKFNERAQLENILERLRAGENWALISDAGTPCINDPGSILVQACIEANIPFTAVPGPSSPILALLLSGFDPSRFQVIGFLPKKPDEILRSCMGFPGTTVAFDSPHRLVETLETIAAMDPKRRVAVVREMTKTFEECKRGTATEVLQHFQAKSVKGEICLVIQGGKFPEAEMPLDELIALLQEFHGLSLKEAIKLAAKLSGKPKSEVYRHVHLDSNE